MLLGAIVGATGVGKTELAVQFALHTGAEIISVDSRQIYQGLAIGTAQPSQEQLQAVKHHLVGVLSPNDTYSVAQFVEDVRMIESAHPEKTFILVGGTGLYCTALMEGMSSLPAVSIKVRDSVRLEYEANGSEAMFIKLKGIDPVSAQRLHAADTQRVLRALEIYKQTGQPWSRFLGQKKGGVGEFPVAWLDRERDELYQCIDLRVNTMFDAGWISETRHLLTQFSETCPALQSLGYRSIINHMNGTLGFDELTSSIQQETRQYAKRQLTWFRNKLKCQRIMLAKGKIDLNLHDLEMILKK